MMHRLRSIRSRHTASSPGQALVLFAFMLPVLIGITGLALDGGNLYYQRRHLQSMADAAAIAGAQHANFDERNPGIVTPDALDDATANAIENGAVASEVAVFVPPVSAPYSSYAYSNAYIEVVVTRDVDSWFMQLFGMSSSRISARAVARSFYPGTAGAALLALNRDRTRDGLDFSGCAGGSSGEQCQIVGDAISHGGIKDTSPSGEDSHIHVDGSTYAYNGNAGLRIDSTGGNYGPGDGYGDGLNYFAVMDPVVQGTHSIPRTFAWPPFPSAPPSSRTDGYWEIWKTVDGVDTRIASGTRGNVTVQNDERAQFWPGDYGPNALIRINSGARATFHTGAYKLKKLDLQGGDSTGNGVLFQLTDTGNAFEDRGGANYTFSAWKPYTTSNPPSLSADPPTPGRCTPTATAPCNTWLDIVLYTPNGDVMMGGTGNHVINGSIYAPTGEVQIKGNNTGYAVNGRVIAQRIKIAGAGGSVNYQPGGSPFIFGPVLVNLP